jgi:glyoxylase-like metal-dependent hydrolase (beta-lactamase superfamily II)
MIVNTFVGNIFSTNTYLVRSRSSREFVCIDPSYGTLSGIMNALIKEGGVLRYIINTHAHFDHIAEDIALKEQTSAHILIGKKDKETLATQNELLTKVALMLRGSEEAGQLKELEHFDPDRWLVDGDIIAVEDLSFTVLETPGHTEGSFALYCEKQKAVFTGDTLFAGTHGRTDLPQSDAKKIISSLKKLAQLPKDTAVYPGHEQATTIEKERIWIDRL